MVLCCLFHGNLLTAVFSLLQFSICLTLVFLLQLAAGVLGFVFSDKVNTPESWGEHCSFEVVVGGVGSTNITAGPDLDWQGAAWEERIDFFPH